MPILSHFFLTESLLTLFPPHPTHLNFSAWPVSCVMALSLASIKHLSGIKMILYSYVFQAIKEGAYGTWEHCLTEDSLPDEDSMGAA